MTEKMTVPTWLNVITVLVIVSNLGLFGIFTYLAPGVTYDGINQAGEFPVRFFAIRHLALSAPLIHGLVTKNKTILATMFRIFLLMSVLDVITLAVYDYQIPFLPDLALGVRVVIAALLFTAPMVIVVRYLNRIERWVRDPESRT